MESAERLEELHALLVFMASLAHGLEATLGRGASTITLGAGRKLGLRSASANTSSDIQQALVLVRESLVAHGIDWPFELFKREGQTEYFYEKGGQVAVQLVFRHCMVRCALLRYAHEQKQSLCMMNHGLFCGYLQKILGRRISLEIVHAGESACLKELLVSDP
jgi:predicted hydrocarbon binding protein